MQGQLLHSPRRCGRTEFWLWCFRHDFADTLRKHELMYPRLMVYRSAQLYMGLVRWGLMREIAALVAWTRLWFVHILAKGDYGREYERFRF